MLVRMFTSGRLVLGRVYDTIFFHEAAMLTDFGSFRGRKRNLWLAEPLRLKIGDVGIFFGPAKAILYH